MPAAARPGTLHSIWMSPQDRNVLQAVFDRFVLYALLARLSVYACSKAGCCVLPHCRLFSINRCGLQSTRSDITFAARSRSQA